MNFKKFTLSVCLLLTISLAKAQTNSVTNSIVSTQKLTNYVRGAFDPTQFNTNVYPYKLVALTLSNIYFQGTNRMGAAPTFPGVGTLSGAINTQVFTNSTNGFAGVNIGDNIAIGTDQYWITSVVSNQYVSVSEPLSKNYTNVSWIIYPNSLRITDINGTMVSFITSGGGYGLTSVGSGNNDKIFLIGGHPDNLNAGSNTFEIQTGAEISGNIGLFIGSKGQASFAIDVAALVNSLSILSNSIVSVKYGLASLATTSPVAIVGTGITNSMGVNATAYVTGAGVTFTNFDNAGTAFLTNTSANVTNQSFHLQPGGKIMSGSGLSGVLVPD